MEIRPKKVYRALEERGVGELYHANTVRTSRHFLREGALLSRGTVERRGWDQTPQTSDEKDKELGVWFDVFLDMGDIHGSLRRANMYGPVLFVVDAKILKEPLTGGVWVTKTNPCHWNEKHHWFPGVTKWESDFRPPWNSRGGWWEHMLVLRHCGGELPFGSHLKKLILDDPGIGDHHKKAHATLASAMTQGGLNIPVEKRQCGGCGCRRKCQANGSILETRFSVD